MIKRVTRLEELTPEEAYTVEYEGVKNVVRFKAMVSLRKDVPYFYLSKVAGLSVRKLAAGVCCAFEPIEVRNLAKDPDTGLILVYAHGLEGLPIFKTV